MSYQLTTNGTIRRLADNALIPSEPANTDYAEYLAWVDEGNTPDPAPVIQPASDYIAFWDVLLASNVYGSIRQQAFTSLPMNTLATEFIALIGDAKAGRPNETAIQASIDAIIATGTFTTADLTELFAALQNGNLEEIYTLPTV